MMSLNTNQGFNAFAVLVPALGIIDAMPDGIWKWGLLGLVCVLAMVVGIKTKGDEPKKPSQIDEHAEIADFPQKGQE